MKKTYTILFVVGAIVFAVLLFYVSRRNAQDVKKAEVQVSSLVSGVVESFDAASIRIKEDNSRESRTVSLGDQTQFTRSISIQEALSTGNTVPGQPIEYPHISKDEIMVGDHVVVFLGDGMAIDVRKQEMKK